jgi:hypothetical protein
MIKTRTLIILAAVTLAGFATLSLLQDDSQTRQDQMQGNLLYQDLTSRLQSASRIRLTSHDVTVILERTGDSWGVVERDGFPADPGKIRQLFAGLAGLEIIEAKTSQAERYHKLGVDMPDDPDSTSTHVIVHDGDNTELVNIVLGRQSASRTTPGRYEFYVRKTDEAQSWLVETTLQAPMTIQEWLDNPLIDIERNRVRQVTIRHQDGTELVVNKADAEAPNFSLADIPDDQQVESPFVPDEIVRTLAGLRIEDVASPDDVTRDGPPALSATLETFNGLKLGVEAWTVEDHHYVAVAAENMNPDDQDTEQQTQSINARCENRVFEIARFDYDSINKKTADILGNNDATPGNNPAPE